MTKRQREAKSLFLSINASTRKAKFKAEVLRIKQLSKTDPDRAREDLKRVSLELKEAEAKNLEQTKGKAVSVVEHDKKSD